MTNFLSGWIVIFWLGTTDAWNWIFLWEKTLDNVYWRGGGGEEEIHYFGSVFMSIRKTANGDC